MIRQASSLPGEGMTYEPLPLPAPAAPRGLRLLCVLVPTRNGSPRALPVHTLHRVPPRVGPKGRWFWKLTPASICAKHTPSNRPPRYWHVVHDTGKPTPFVPLREPFELVG